MHRAYSFPVTVERSRTKERLEASLAGLCELELRKQRQECLVLGALSLGEPLDQERSRGDLACFSSWGQENLTLRRQLSALQSSPWGLMQALEQQVGELRIDTDDGCCDGAQADAGDSRPSSGFYESSEGHSPKGISCSSEPREAVSPWTYTNDRPKSVGDPIMLNGEADAAALHTTLPRSFSAPYPPLQDIAEETTAVEQWQDGFSRANQVWPPTEDQVTEEDYQQALRVENYILRLIQRHVLPPRPCQPRTTLSPDPPYCSAPGHSSLHRRTSSLTTELRLPDPHLQAHINLSSDPKIHGWSSDPLEKEDCGGEVPSLEEDCYLALPYPQSRPHSLIGRLPSPLPPQDPNCGVGALDLCCEPASPHHYLHPHPPSHHKHNFVNAQFIPGQACIGPFCSPRHHNPEHPKFNTAAASPDHLTSSQIKSKTSKKGNNERQKSKKSSSKTNRSHSENSLLTQRVLPERRYSTTERHQGRGDLAQNHGQVPGLQGGNNSHSVCQRWCSNQELSQDEGETHSGQAQRRPARKARQGPLHSQFQNYQQQEQQNTERWHTDHQERAPLCQGEEAYAGAAPAESESSMSEVYSPASSSLSSDSDESGGLVWPQQLPPRLASVTSSPPSQTAANGPSQPKAFVKIKASHALKKKILRFRSGSLKVMTTV